MLYPNQQLTSEVVCPHWPSRFRTLMVDNFSEVIVRLRISDVMGVVENIQSRLMGGLPVDRTTRWQFKPDEPRLAKAKKSGPKKSKRPKIATTVLPTLVSTEQPIKSLSTFRPAARRRVRR